MNDLNESAASLGFIGLGVMGGAMCENLVKRSKIPVHVFDTSVAALDQAAQTGAVPRASIDDLAAHAEVVFLSLPSIRQVEQVVGKLLDAIGKVRMIVDMSTSAVDGTRRLAQRSNAAGVHYIDAPVARRRQAAAEGTLLITVGAGAGEFEWIRPVLEHLGSDIVHTGPVGSGQVLKILNNMVLLLNTTALAEAAAIAKGAGVDLGTAFATLTLGSADSYVLRTTARDTIVPNEYPEGAFPVDYAAKDLALALDIADELGIKAEAARHTMSLLENAHVRGEGSLYYPVIARQIRMEETR